jgi:hypothetical protein
MRLALSTGHKRVGVSFPLPEDGNGSSFRNTVSRSYLKFQKMNKVQKPSDSNCYARSSESFRIYMKPYRNETSNSQKILFKAYIFSDYVFF